MPIRGELIQNLSNPKVLFAKAQPLVELVERIAALRRDPRAKHGTFITHG
jgi:hypothetical protein